MQADKVMFSKQLSEPDLLVKTPNSLNKDIFRISFKNAERRRVRSARKAHHSMLQINSTHNNQNETIEEVKSGVSSRRGSRESIDENELIKNLDEELKEYISMNSDLKI